MRLVSIDIQKNCRMYYYIDDEGKTRYEEEHKGDNKQSFICEQFGIPWEDTKDKEVIKMTRKTILKSIAKHFKEIAELCHKFISY